jgi:anthranilate phosphoribosyltransferase
MISRFLARLTAGEHLDRHEAADLLAALMGDEATDAQIAAVLVALAMKGETEDEIAGFAETMRARCSRVVTRHKSYVDTCGTGGSVAKTFNVSTASAFVVAAAGMPVAKHGNAAVSSRSGSADVLRSLGVRIELVAKRVAECIDEIGIGFMFAPLHHAATKRVAVVRRSLQVPTIFNLLGPLTNPAQAPHQVIGVSRAGAGEKVAKAAAHLGTLRTWVVRGEDGLDEITLGGTTQVFEAGESGIRTFELHPEDFGVPVSEAELLRGGTADDNAGIILAVFRRERKDAARSLILMNAAAALFVSGAVNDVREGTRRAADVIDSGAALKKVEALVSMTNRI